MVSRLETYGAWLSSDPAGFVVYMLYLVAAALLSLILHECAHGWVALQCGDNTARMLGRLTLDPRKHLDPIGTVSMFLLGFGWARPVPVNPRNFRDPRRDDFLVSVAGITVNMTLFLLCTALSVGVHRVMVGGQLYAIYSAGPETRQELYELISDWIAYGGASLPREVAAYMAVPWLQYVQRFLIMMRSINLALAVFNLLPIPPLDGFRLLNNLLKGRFRLTQQTFQVMQFALLMLCLTGALGGLLSKVTGALDDAVVHMLMLL